MKSMFTVSLILILYNCCEISGLHCGDNERWVMYKGIMAAASGGDTRPLYRRVHNGIDTKTALITWSVVWGGY